MALDTDSTPTSNTEQAARDEAYQGALAALSGDEPDAAEPSAPQSTDEPQDDGKEADPEPAKKADKKDDEPDPAEKLGKGFQKLRKDRKALDAARAELAQAKETFRAQSQDIIQKARDGEKALAQLDSVRSLIARAQEGDVEALAELGLDVARLNEGYLRASSPDAKTSKLEKMIADLQAKLDKRDKDETEAKTRAQKEAEEDRLYQQAVSLTLKAAKAKTRLLASYDDAEVVQMAEARAMSYARAGKPVPHPDQLVEEVERQLVEDLQKRRALLDGAPPQGGAKGPATVTARDKGTRGNKDKKPFVYDRNREASDVERILKGEAVDDEDD